MHASGLFCNWVGGGGMEGGGAGYSCKLYETELFYFFDTAIQTISSLFLVLTVEAVEFFPLYGLDSHC